MARLARDVRHSLATLGTGWLASHMCWNRCEVQVENPAVLTALLFIIRDIWSPEYKLPHGIHMRDVCKILTSFTE